MKTVYRSGYNGFRVYDEKRETVGFIRRKPLCTSALDIEERNGSPLCSFVRSEGKITVRCSSQTQTCILNCRTGADGHPVQGSVVRPPMVDHVLFHTEYGTFRIIQNKNRSFDFILEDMPAGRGTHMLSYCREIQTDGGPFSLLLHMQLFCICYLMLHDDDIEIV